MDLKDEDLSVQCMQKPDDSAMLRALDGCLFLHVIEDGVDNTVQLNPDAAQLLAEALIDWVNEQ